MSSNSTQDTRRITPQKEAETGGMTDTVQSRRLRWVRRVLPVVFLVLVTVLAARELRGLDIHAVRAVLQALTLPHLLIIQLIAMAGVMAMSLYDWLAARAFDLGLAPRTLILNAWIANAFNNLVGFSGLAGSGIRMLLLTGEGIDARKAAAFSAMIMATVPVGLAVLSWPLLLSGGPGMDRLPIPGWTAWLGLGAFAAYLPVYVFTFHKGLFARLLHGLAPQSAASLAALIAISTLDWLLAATTAWVALDFGGAVIPWPQFLPAFVLASTLGILSLIPGGLGVFDAALVVLLYPFAHGSEHLVSGVLVYRLCYYLVPWLIAVYLGADKLMLPQYWQHTLIVRQWRESKLPGLLRLPLNALASLGVRALAYLCFGGGVVLLASAAFPALADRLAVLHRYVPLAATASARPDAQSLAETETILNQYGGSEFAHLLFLGDKFLLWAPDRKAFIQYGKIRDRLMALGDPCGDPAAFDAAIIAFRDYADRHDLTPCFYEVSETHMHRDQDAGFALFKLGETAVVELEAFTTAGKRGESLRHSVNRAKQAGVKFELLDQPLSDALWPQLRAISDAWLAERGAAEKGFSLGNYDEAYLRRSPIAVIRVNERVVAFANLTPDYGSHAELSIDLMRYRPDAPPGTMDYLFVELLQYAQAQGYQYFNLGMAPLAGVGKTRYARSSEKVARLAFEYGNRFYNYKGLRSFKDEFHPAWRSAYLAYPVLTPLPTLLLDSAALIAGGYRRIFFKSG